MALSSRLFRGDQKLEAAQASDPAHLTLGAMGPHVAKVQMALFAIDSLVIDRGELRTETYGPSTAKAVLLYKTARKIINKAYQQKADDIVGKMTITRLDEEMSAWERAQTHRGDCRSSSHGGQVAPALLELVSLGSMPLASVSAPTRLGYMAAPAPLGLMSAREQLGFMSAREAGGSISLPATRVAASNPAGRAAPLAQLVKNSSAPPPAALPQLARALRVYCSITKQASLEDDFPIAQQLEKARNRLFDYGMTLSVEFGATNGKALGDTINFAGGLVIDEDVGLLRKASEDTRPGSPKILRIIVCPRSVNAPFGETFRNVTIGNVRFLPFVVLNSKVVAKDNSTLLHEMIHASYDQSVDHDGESYSVFYKHAPENPESPDRTWLKPERAIALSKAFFAQL